MAARIPGTAAALLLASSASVVGAPLATPAPSAPFSIRTPDGDVPMVMVGAKIGEQVVDGFKVTLYFLQAGSPEKLPAGTPTHLFRVSLLSEPGGKLVKEAQGTLSISGMGGTRKAALSRSAGEPPLFQAALRVDSPGRHKIEVAFQANGKKRAARFAFDNPLRLGKMTPSGRKETP